MPLCSDAHSLNLWSAKEVPRVILNLEKILIHLDKDHACGKSRVALGEESGATWKRKPRCQQRALEELKHALAFE